MTVDVVVAADVVDERLLVVVARSALAPADTMQSLPLHSNHVVVLA